DNAFRRSSPSKNPGCPAIADPPSPHRNGPSPSQKPAVFRGVQANNPSSRLCGKPAYSQAHRGGVQLDQDSPRTVQGQAQRPKVDWAFTFAAADYNLVRAPKVTAACRDQPGLRADRPVADHKGRSLWDRGYLDFVEPAYPRSAITAGPSLPSAPSTARPNSN